MLLAELLLIKNLPFIVDTFDNIKVENKLLYLISNASVNVQIYFLKLFLLRAHIHNINSLNMMLKHNCQSKFTNT